MDKDWAGDVEVVHRIGRTSEGEWEPVKVTGSV
jgi:hypothetical protein